MLSIQQQQQKCRINQIRAREKQKTEIEEFFISFLTLVINNQ